LEEKMSRSKLTAIAGLAMAIVFVSGFFVRIYIATGYYNLEDLAVVLIAYIFRKKTIVVAGGIGAGLVDILSGFAIFAIASALIYIAIGVVMVNIFNAQKNHEVPFGVYTGAVVVCEAIMFAGYVLFNCLIAGFEILPAVSLFYVPQVLLNTAVALALGFPLARKLHKIIQTR
jgi:uncharacterized membrane protein